MLAACGGGDLQVTDTTTGSRAPSEYDFASEAEAYIHEPEGDVAKQLGEQFGIATCEQPFNTDIGEQFTCTAATRDGTLYEFEVEITSEHGFTVQNAWVAPTTT